jgi:hypothetical protein
MVEEREIELRPSGRISQAHWRNNKNLQAFPRWYRFLQLGGDAQGQQKIVGLSARISGPDIKAYMQTNYLLPRILTKTKGRQ